jgi:hypothetical protein
MPPAWPALAVALLVFSNVANAATTGCPVRDAPATASPVVWQPTQDAIYPVEGSDGLIHLVYSAQLTNITDHGVNLLSIEAVDPATGNPFGSNDVVSPSGQNIGGRASLFALPPAQRQAQFATELPAGQAGSTYLNIVLPDTAHLPCSVALRIHATQPDAPQGSPVRDSTATGGAIPVSRTTAIVLSPPVHGKLWLDGDGCCRVIGGHRWVLNPINGALKPAETYAIDIMQLDDQHRLFSGNPAELKSWHSYGADVVAAHGGKVVQTVDSLPDQTPGAALPTPSLETAAGNSVIIDMGGGRYALYAHLQPHSLTVKPGDTVRTGQRLGALGSSGNSDAPHLHFQVMDRPSSLDAVGLPFVFAHMQHQARVKGTMDDMVKPAMAGQPIPLDTSGVRALDNRMPLSLEIVGFN